VLKIVRSPRLSAHPLISYPLYNTFANERRKKALKVKRAFVGN
jgi:hypothetical protein